MYSGDAMQSSLLRLAVCLAAIGCVQASHHIRVMDARRVPRAAPCEHPVIDTEGGADRPHVALAIVTAECGSGKEDECRVQLEIGTCRADADALINVTRQNANGHLRMVGTAVEYLAATP